MARVIALDVGSRRIGVAVSDELGILATPRGAIFRATLRKDIAAVQALVAETEAERIIVGHPVGLSGASTSETHRAERFGTFLAAELTIPVDLWDERMTTVLAERAMIEGGARREERREKVDRVAAALILQSFLDARPGI